MNAEQAGSGSGRVAVGVYDFSYGPYALGDALTWSMNLACLAADRGCDGVDQVLFIDPKRPSSRYQPFITGLTAPAAIDALLPGFLCTPGLRSLKVLRDAPTFHRFLWRDGFRRPMWPSLWQQLNRRLDQVSHFRINAFWRKHGQLPRLQAPRGHLGTARAWLAKAAPGRFTVAVNLRQSVRAPLPANLFRDAPLPEWYAFFDAAARSHPDTLFVLLGGYGEWDRRLLRLPNLTIPRREGLGLGEELALVTLADMFMGSSSGFAAMATFADRPYLITKVEHLFARYVEVPVGAAHYPFGAAHQRLLWCEDERDLLMAEFVALRARIDEGIAAGRIAGSPSGAAS